MKWILLALIDPSAGYIDGGITSLSVEFNTRKHCESAGWSLQQMKHRGERIRYICVKKGPKQ